MWKALRAARREVKTHVPMDHHPAFSLADQLAAAQAWWRDAGVDCLFREEPKSWLPVESEAPGNAGAQASMHAATAIPEQPRMGGEPATWPQDLARFREWWLSEPSLDEGGAYPRVAPRGRAGPALMVLVPEPEAEDHDALLSGPQGRLVTNMLSAMGIGREDAYLAAALPRHMPLADWTGLAASGLGAILLHHISLVLPQRLMVLGNSVLPLLGHEPAQAPARLREISIKSNRVPTIATRGPAYLLGRADARAAVWQRWLDRTQTGWNGGGKEAGEK